MAIENTVVFVSFTDNVPLMCYYIFFPLESQVTEYLCHEFEMFWEYTFIEHVK